MAHERIHELAAVAALGALEPGEQHELDEHLKACDECRGEAESLRDAAAVLALAYEPVRPPAALRGRLLEAARAEAPNVVPLRPRGHLPRPVLAALAAAAAVALA